MIHRENKTCLFENFRSYVDYLTDEDLRKIENFQTNKSCFLCVLLLLILLLSLLLLLLLLLSSLLLLLSLLLWHGLIPAIESGFSGGFGWQCSAVFLFGFMFFACGVRVELPIKPFKIQQFANH